MKDREVTCKEILQVRDEAASIRDLATDPTKRDMFDRLHEHLPLTFFRFSSATSLLLSFQFS